MIPIRAIPVSPYSFTDISGYGIAGNQHYSCLVDPFQFFRIPEYDGFIVIVKAMEHSRESTGRNGFHRLDAMAFNRLADVSYHMVINF